MNIEAALADDTTGLPVADNCNLSPLRLVCHIFSGQMFGMQTPQLTLQFQSSI